MSDWSDYMEYLNKQCVKISRLCDLQLLRKKQQKFLLWTDGSTDKQTGWTDDGQMTDNR